MIQLTIFDIEPPKKEPKKLRLETMRTDNLEHILKDLGFDGLMNGSYWHNKEYYFVRENSVMPCITGMIKRPLLITSGHNGIDSTLVEIDPEGNAFQRTLHFQCMGLAQRCASTATISVTPMKPLKRIPVGVTALVQTDKELESILAKKSSYTARFLEEKRFNGCSAALLLLAPQVEQLCKAGYSFANEMFTWNPNADSMNSIRAFDNIKSKVECFNRLTQPGTSPKTIFKTSKAVYSALKEEKSLPVWDSYRKMDKFGRIRCDEIDLLYNGGYGNKEIGMIASILGKQYQGKPVFNLRSLLQYLDRIDMFEAIPRMEGLGILNDYLAMCSQLDVQPRVDGDSLKREHDIMARNCRNRRDELMAKKMENVGQMLKKYDYEEDIFFIRGIQSYDDLIDEANQQHNCVASYASRIVSNKSKIYVMRLKSDPNRSLITVELTPDGKEIRQKLLAYNRPIHNKAQTDFLNRWLAFCRNGGNQNSGNSKTVSTAA